MVELTLLLDTVVSQTSTRRSSASSSGRTQTTEEFDPSVLRVRQRNREDGYVAYIFRVNWADYNRVVAEGDTGEFVVSAGDTSIPLFGDKSESDGKVAAGWVECIEVDDKRDELLWKTGPRSTNNAVAEVMEVATTDT